MVLMTDGRKNRGIEPVISARRAAELDITIHTVTFSDEADFPRMQAVAAESGGEHFHAPDAAALERIFRQIASTLPVLLTATHRLTKQNKLALKLTLKLATSATTQNPQKSLAKTHEPNNDTTKTITRQNPPRSDGSRVRASGTDLFFASVRFV